MEDANDRPTLCKNPFSIQVLGETHLHDDVDGWKHIKGEPLFTKKGDV